MVDAIRVGCGTPFRPRRIHDPAVLHSPGVAPDRLRVRRSRKQRWMESPSPGGRGRRRHGAKRRSSPFGMDADGGRMRPVPAFMAFAQGNQVDLHRTNSAPSGALRFAPAVILSAGAATAASAWLELPGPFHRSSGAPAAACYHVGQAMPYLLGTGRMTRFFVILAVLPLLAAAPLASAVHEHPDSVETHCGFCVGRGSDEAMVRDAPGAGVSRTWIDHRLAASVPAPPMAPGCSGDPRAPPS